MNNFLLFIGGVLVLLLGAAFAVPQYVDWNEYRASFEDEVSSVLGRPIRVGGNVDLRLLPSPYIRFERLRVADENGRFSRPFFKADGFKLWLSVAPLLRGTIEAKQVELIRPQLRLEFDQNGKGNWSSSDKATGAGKILAAHVALQSVAMKSGTVVVVKSDGSELIRLTAINGDFSARSIHGPFNFKGSLVSGGRQRRVRLASGRMDNDGAMTVKTVVTSGGAVAVAAKVAARPTRFTFDGQLQDFFGSAKLDGKLSAKLPLLLHGGDEPGRPALFDLKSKLTVNVGGLKLSGLSLAFEQAGRPQLLSGEIAANWEDGVATKASFSSRWLDLDRIAGGGQIGPVQAMAGIIDQLNALLGKSKSSRASLAIDQANLGGDIVSDIFIDLSQTGGRLTLEALRASLPGRAKIVAKGLLAGSEDKRTFDGDVVLHGGNLKQFTSWALPAQHYLTQIGTGPFSLSSRVGAGTGWAFLREINGEFGETVIAGTVKYDWRGNGAIMLDLEAPRFDASELLPGGLRIAGLLERLRRPWSRARAGGGGDQGSNARGGGTAAPDFAKAIKLQVGRLRVGKDVFQDVAVDFSLKNGKLLLPTLKLSSGDDLSIELAGSVMGIDTTPSGAIQGTLRALTSNAADKASRIFDVPQELRPAPERGAALVPLRLAGRMTFGTPNANGAAIVPAAKSAKPPPGGARSSRRAALTLSGSSAGGRTDLTVDLDGGLQGWRDALADIVLTMRNPRSSVLMKQLLPAGKGYRAATAGEGVLRFRSVGVPARGLTTIASLQAQGMSGNFDGQLHMGKGGAGAASLFERLTGQVELDVKDASTLLVALGLDGGAAGAAANLSGQMKIDARRAVVALSQLRLIVNGSGVTGQATIADKGKGRHELNADLTASSMTVMALIAPALRQENPGEAERGAATSAGLDVAATGNDNTQSIWPATPFDFKSLALLDGNIKLKTASLKFGADLELSDAAAEILLSKGRLVLKSLTGKALGGRMSGELQLSQALAGAKLRGALKLEGADLAQLLKQDTTGAGQASRGPAGARGADNYSGQAAATGQGSMTLSFAGQALSPRGIIAVLSGGGAISIGAARLHRMSALAINASADAVLDQKPDKPDEAIRRELVQRLRSGDYELGPRQIKLTVGNGALRAERFAIETAEGTITTTNVVDLASLMLDSEWKIKPKAQVSPITGRTLRALPEVTVTYVGALGRLGALKPQVDAAALVRELTVREMERDVEKLEQLRKADEKQSRREAERRRQVELERARRQALIKAQQLRQQEAGAREFRNDVRTGTVPPNAVQRQELPPLQGNDARLGPSRSLQSSGIAPPVLQNEASSAGAAAAGAGAGELPGNAGTAELPPRPIPRPRRAAKRKKKKWDPFAE